MNCVWAESCDQTSDAQTEESQFVVVGCCFSLCKCVCVCVCVLTLDCLCFSLYQAKPFKFRNFSCTQITNLIFSSQHASGCSSAHGFPLMKRKVRQKLFVLLLEWMMLHTDYCRTTNSQYKTEKEEKDISSAVLLWFQFANWLYFI